MNKTLIFTGIGVGLFLAAKKTMEVSDFIDNISYQITGATSYEISKTQLQFNVHLQLDNPTSFEISLDNILVDIFLDLHNTGDWTQIANSLPTNRPVTIKPFDTTRLKITPAVNLIKMGALGWSIITGGFKLGQNRYKIVPKASKAGKIIIAEPVIETF